MDDILISTERRKGLLNANVASYFEFLAVIIVGVFGMLVSELAATTGSLIDSILGTIITYGAAAWIVVRLINEILNLIDRFKGKR